MEDRLWQKIKLKRFLVKGCLCFGQYRDLNSGPNT
jgi:hypothetical protein